VKNPTPRALALLSGITFFIAYQPLTWLIDYGDFNAFTLGCVLSLLVVILVFIVVEYYLYRKVKSIYKLIFNHKTGKSDTDLAGMLAHNPLAEVTGQIEKYLQEKEQAKPRELALEQYRKQFIGNVSHELKTPIFNIQGYVHSLLDGAMEDPMLARHFLKKAARSADRMEQLVQDLLSISELEGDIDLDWETYDIHDQCRDVCEALEFKAGERGIVLSMKPGLRPPFFVRADKKKIRQVLINLLSNSIRYGKEKGSTFIGIYDMDSHYLVDVTDTGIGIEAEHLPRLFDRFYRVDASRSREQGGTGLGLSIVKHIVEAHGQQVHVRSSPGMGTTFGFTLAKAPLQ
jgi:two-component system phosphate regulon sensor histidine kinase PhoR